MNRTLVMLLFFTCQFALAQSSSYEQVSSSSACSLDPFNKHFRCLDEWDPCDETYWNTQTHNYLAPMKNSDLIGSVPKTPKAWGLEMCGSDYTLKNGWVLYDRYLEKEDRNNSSPILAKRISDNTSDPLNGSNPFFAAYNKNTGLLRTFLWVQDNTPTPDSLLLINSEIVDVDLMSTQHGFGIFDNGQSSGYALGESELKYPTTWMSILNVNKTHGYWQVIDRYLSYEPWQTIADNGRNKLRGYYIRMRNKSVQSISLNGKIVDASAQEGGLSFFNNNPTAAAVTKYGIKGITSAMSDNFLSYLKNGNEKTTVSDVLGTQNETKSNWNESSFSSLVNLGLTAAAGGPLVAVGSMIAGKLLPTTYSFSKITLDGEIVNIQPVNAAAMTLPGDEIFPPVYARANSVDDANKVGVGLFTLTSPPKVRLSISSTITPIISPIQIDCSSGSCHDIGSKYVGNRTAYQSYISIDDPLCDLVVNPNSDAQLTKILVRPVIWNKDDGQWIVAGTFNELKQVSEFGGVSWFGDVKKCDERYGGCTGGDYLGDAKNLRVGIDVYFEFKIPTTDSETGYDVFAQQKVFDADLDFVGGRQNLGTSPQMCTVDASNQVLMRGIKHRNSVTNISISTGSSDHANTDANVSLIATGCDNFSETYSLYSHGVKNFQKDGVDEFSIPTILDHGPLQKIAFVVDNESASWQMSNFSVKQTNLETGLVTGELAKLTSQWIEKGETGVTVDNNGNLVWEYSNANTEASCASYAAANADEWADYDVNVLTENVKYAETAASVALKICGTLANSNTQECFNETVNNLSKGSTQSLSFNGALLTNITSVTVTHQGNGDAWRPDDITVNVKPRSSTNADALYQFSFRQWLASSASAVRYSGKGMAYSLEVTTANVAYAGTDAGIYAKLCNKAGTACANFKLDNTTVDDNNTNTTSNYKFYSETVLSDVGSLTLYNDGKGSQSGWRPYSVNVKTVDLSSNSTTPVSYNFWYDQWLAGGVLLGDPNTAKTTSSISLALSDYSDGGNVTLTGGTQSYRNADVGLGYDLAIHTSDIGGAGTSANVWAKVTTCANEDQYFQIDNRADNFEQNDNDAFHFFRNSDPSKNNAVKSISLMHDAAGNQSGWDVNTVSLKVKDPNNSDALVTDYSETWDSWIGKNQTIVNDQFSVPNESATFYGFTKIVSSCPSVTALITGLAKVSANALQGEYVDISGKNLGTNSLNWTATLNGSALNVVGVTASRIRIAVPQAQQFGSQPLVVANASNGISWNSSLNVVAKTPSVTAISHIKRTVGDYFELLGQQFGMDETAIEVKIGSVVAPVVRLLDGRVSLLVPQMAAGTYNVSLSVRGQVALQTFPLTIQAVIPAITGVQPSTVAPGATLGILGRNFGTDISGIKVKLGSIVLTPSVVTDSRISVVIPETTASGIYAVTLTRAGVSATGSALVEVLRMPTFLNFDDPTQKWTSDETTLQRDDALTSKGSGASLQINGSGYRVIRSPRFNTTDLGQFSDTLAFDLYIPKGVSNPSWLGEAAFFVDDPAAGLNNAWQSNVQLTGLSLGAWHTIRIPLSAAVVDAMAGDYPNMQFSIVVNAAAATGTYHLDECRFVGVNLQYRTVEHQIGSRNLNVIVPDKMGFEASDPWVVPQNVVSSYVADPREQGLTALKIGANGFMHLESPALGAYELKTATSVLNVDVYVPDPQPNAWWIGNVAVTVDCPADGIYNQYLGQKDLTHLFRKEYNGIQFNIPTPMLMRLQQSAGGCKFGVDLNVTNGPAPFLLDKMGFVHTAGEVIEPSSSSSDMPSSSSSSASGSGVGTGSSFICTGMCAVATASDIANQTLTLGTTGEAWYVLTKLPAGWQGSEMAGRTVEVNGIAVTFGGQLPSAAKDGKWYFRFTAGTHSWASWSWWS